MTSDGRPRNAAPMTCGRAGRLVHSWIDGELQGATALELQAHLRRCGACTAREEEERRIRAALRAEAPVLLRRPRALSPSLVILRDRRMRADEAAMVRVVKRAAAAAALLLLGSGLLLGGLQAGQGKRVEASTIRVLTAAQAAPRLEDFIHDQNSIVLAIPAGSTLDRGALDGLELPEY
jgi:anti-sigma factor RsiW